MQDSNQDGAAEYVGRVAARECGAAAEQCAPPQSAERFDHCGPPRRGRRRCKHRRTACQRSTRKLKAHACDRPYGTRQIQTARADPARPTCRPTSDVASMDETLHLACRHCRDLDVPMRRRARLSVSAAGHDLPRRRTPNFAICASPSRSFGAMSQNSLTKWRQTARRSQKPTRRPAIASPASTQNLDRAKRDQALPAGRSERMADRRQRPSSASRSILRRHRNHSARVATDQCTAGGDPGLARASRLRGRCRSRGTLRCNRGGSWSGCP